MAYPLYQADLRQIREAKGLTIDDLSRKTHITPDVLLQFEETGLLNHPRFNNVYLRALVKTIAEALRIPVDAGVQALEDSLSGNYEGSLRAYLGGMNVPPAMVVPPPAKVEAPKAEAPKVEAPKVEAPKAEAPKAEAPKTGAPVKGKGRGNKSLDLIDVEIKPTVPDLTPIKTEVKSALEVPNADQEIENAISALTEEKEEMVVVKAEDVKKAEAKPKVEPSSEKLTIKPSTLTFDDTVRGAKPANLPPRQIDWEPSSGFSLNIRSIVLGLCGLIIVGGIVWLMGDQSGWWGGSAPVANSPETTVNGTVTTNKENTPKAVALPDSIKFTLVAAKGTVSPAYLTKDDAVKPMQHWIEMGDSTTVYAKQKLVITSKSIKNMTLKVQGKTWTIAGQDTAKSLVLTRDAIQKTLK